MLHRLLLLALTSFLSANSLHTLAEQVPLDKPFIIKADSNIFDDSMVYTHQVLFNCSPKLDVVYKIESKQQIKLIPKSSLPSSSHYSCSYKNTSFNLQTVHLQIKESHYFSKSKILRLEFNDRVSTQRLKEALTLTKFDKLSSSKLNFSIMEHNNKTIMIKINEFVGQYPLEAKLDLQRLEKPFIHIFNIQKPVILDKEKKDLILPDSPRMVSLKTGEFALRLFLEDTLEGSPEKSIQIEGIENFTLNPNNYIDYTIREKFKLSNEAYYYTDIISDDFKPNQDYHLTLKKGLSTYKELKKDKHFTLKTKNRAKSIFFRNDKHYISNSGELGFSSVNIDHVTLIVERLLDDNLRYFINFNNAQATKVTPYSKEVLNKELNLENRENEIVQQKFSLKALSQGLEYGVYKISLRYDEPYVDEDNQEQKEEHLVSKVVFISDLGISVELAKSQAFISVRSLKSAKPIAKATVELYGANNALLKTIQTNKDGVAMIEKKGLLKEQPKAVIVKTDKDKNFLALIDTIQSPSSYEILDEPQRFKAHIYFQSEILRPASELHALITIKDRDFISANKLPIKITLQEEYGKELVEKIYHTDAYGLIDFKHQFDNEDRIGNYILTVSIGDWIIGAKLLQVEAFMPPKIENHLSTNKNIYKKGELIELNISSSYLFGAPASKLQGSVTLKAHPIEYKNRNYANFSFSNATLQNDNVQSYIDFYEPFNLNQKGHYSLVLSTKLSQKVPSILEAMIGVTIMDDNQPLSNYKKVKLYPYTNMVGIKLEQNAFKKGKRVKGEAILINPITGKKIKGNLHVLIKKIDWQYDYSEGEYNWNKETSIIDSFTLEANTPFQRNIHESGDYILEVYDHLGGHSSSNNFNVLGWSYSNISPKDDLKSIEINIENKLYKKGDKLEVQLKSPILEGQLLVSLESDHVQKYQEIELHKGVAKLSFDIDFEMKRGCYLHAIAIRPSNSSSKLIPFRAMGYQFIKPNRDEHKIKLGLTVPKISKSKVPLTLKITTDKPAKLLVSLVDSAILELIEQEKPKLFDYFNEQANQALSHYDLYEQLMNYIAEGKLISFGAGDDSLSKRKKHFAPDLGKRIKPFMFWSDLIDMTKKEANVTIEIPEFNGRASIVVIAINKDSIGVIEKDITIKDDIILKPSYPKYTLVGDHIEIPLRIFNSSPREKNITIESQFSENLSFVLKEKNITLPPNSSKLLIAMLHAKNIGKGEITLVAHDKKNNRISNSVELPVYSPFALSTQTFQGITNKRQIFRPRPEYKNAKVMITLSNNLIGALRNDLKYLISYPYGCAEQTASKMAAMHYAKPFLEEDYLLGESKNFIRQGSKKLSNMQNNYGEFFYWEKGSHINAYASLYAGQTLLELSKDGVKFDKNLINNTLEMLKNIASNNGNYEGTYSRFHRLYAAYILAEANQLEESIANMIYEKKLYQGHFLSTFYMAAILKIQGKNRLAKQLYFKHTYALSRYAIKPYRDYSGNFESNVRDMFLHFIIKTKYFNKDDKDLLTVKKEFDALYSTQSKAVALKAMNIYLKKPQRSRLNVTIHLNAEHKKYTKPTLIIIKELNASSIILEPKYSAMSYSVEFIKPLAKNIKNKLSTQKELSLKREFIDEHQKPVHLYALHQGEKIYSKITLSNYGKINQVVVNQRIPSCMTIINSHINTQESFFKNKNLSNEYREIQDDRVLNFFNLKKKEEYDKHLKQYITIQNISTIYTPLMVTTKGECRLPAVITEAMYDTRLNDYAKERENIYVKSPQIKK